MATDKTFKSPKPVSKVGNNPLSKVRDDKTKGGLASVGKPGHKGDLPLKKKL